MGTSQSPWVVGSAWGPHQPLRGSCGKGLEALDRLEQTLRLSLVRRARTPAEAWLHIPRHPPSAGPGASPVPSGLTVSLQPQDCPARGDGTYSTFPHSLGDTPRAPGCLRTAQTRRFPTPFP